MRELLVNGNFPDGALTINVHEKQQDGKPIESLENLALMRHCLTNDFIDDFGL